MVECAMAKKKKAQPKTEIVEDAHELEVVVQKSALVSKAEEARLSIREAESTVYQESLEVLHGTMLFSQLKATFTDEFGMVPDEQEVPEGWVREYGVEKAERLFRLAQAGGLNKSLAPAGVDISLKFATSVLKAKSQESQGSRELNIGTMVVLGRPDSYYPTIQVKDKDD